MEPMSVSPNGSTETLEDGHTASLEGALTPKGLRRKREFIPEEKKDVTYWEKRRKNNEAAKRSREKRRVNDYVLESRLAAMNKENARLNTELLALKLHFGLVSPAGYAAHQSSLLRLHHAHTHSPHSPPPSSPTQPLDKDVYWGRRPSYRDPSTLPNYHHLPPVLTGQLAPAMINPHALPTRRAYPYFLEIPGVVHPANSSSLLLPPLLPSPLLSWPGVPLLRPTPRRGGSDEEGEQQVPAASSSTALPHKLRLKTIRGPTVHRDVRDRASPQLPLYVSD
ncbi:nuclear factor interleukin-3-regulated protein [Salmo salar]|uniref:Nuclear factor interleukin-3-regulated protein n=1 Tax=Salmo salar TaxID=8030 RepID=A0A1S3PCC5_SALSA|nr:nuclear factor interleukin-3-regulated protein-like [Salmo salar]|eukprot:XP_014025226.1 PREDICTED: nuclear factor interleukin-3-regulated protein-like [Salmo salar]